MKKIKGMRWWMLGLITIGLIVNYLGRTTLSSAALSMKPELHISDQQYSFVVATWQICYAAMQPVAGHILDSIGTKLGWGIFALAWSAACASAAFATGWQSLAFLRGSLGVAEAAGIPAGVKATTEWFPAKERSIAIGWFNIGSSIGALCAPGLVWMAVVYGNWRWAFVIVGALSLTWNCLWMLFYKHPKNQKHLSDAERDYILSGQEVSQEASQDDRLVKKASRLQMFRNRNFWAIAIPRFLSEPGWQTFLFWIPLYMMNERHMNLKEIAMFAWLPFLAADIGCVVGGYLSPIFHKFAKVSLFTSRKLVVGVGAICMIGPACIGLVSSPYSAIALLCVGGFAHQTLSGGLYAITSDVFGKNEVATATGLGGMSGYLGAAIFSMLFGVLVTRVGYAPLFAVLAGFDLIALVVLTWLVRERHVVDTMAPDSTRAVLSA